LAWRQLPLGQSILNWIPKRAITLTRSCHLEFNYDNRSEDSPAKAIQYYVCIVERRQSRFRPVVWLGLMLAQCACAATPSPLLRQYGHTSWASGDGLPFVADFAMAQTPDGYLWLGGEFGLFRFDAKRLQ
jgi:hypothetical protein